MRLKYSEIENIQSRKIFLYIYITNLVHRCGFLSALQVFPKKKKIVTGSLQQ